MAKVVMEHMDDRFAQMGEMMEIIHDDVKVLKTEMVEVKERLDGVELRLYGVENRLDGVENRLDGVENRLDGVENRLDNIEEIIAPMTLDHRARIIDLENTTENHGTRIAKLEHKTA